MSKKKTVHYIDNKEFYKEMVEFRKLNIERVERGERPIISNSIGEKIYKICWKLSGRYNFHHWARLREDMVSMAVENCIKHIWNFNPDEYKSPFSYFTMVAYRAMIRCIEKERKKVSRDQEVWESSQVTSMIEGYGDPEQQYINSNLYGSSKF